MTDRIAAAFVPLVDCAVLVAARECGFAAAEGIDLQLVKEPSWASLRDHLSTGAVDCAHSLAPLPVAAALGAGRVQYDCFVPFVLGRGGNAITVSNAVHDAMLETAGGRAFASPAEAGRALAAAVRRREEPLTFAMVFPFSSHNYELRYWLASAGLDPDRDVRLVAVPPPLMVASLRAGHIDGFCVGEPWSSLAVRESLGAVVATKAQLVPHGVEKVLAVHAALDRQPALLGRLLRALDAAARWADEPSHRGTLAGLLARPEHIDTDAALLEAALAGRLPGRPPEPDFIYFHRHDANRPSGVDGLFAYAQMARWGQLRPSVAAEARAALVFRADLYARHVGGSEPVQRATVNAFDDVVFDGRDVGAYLDRFAIRTPYTDPAAPLDSF